jgi:FMN phosphatase YigB (HAD superfamily)
MNKDNPGWGNPSLDYLYSSAHDVILIRFVILDRRLEMTQNNPIKAIIWDMGGVILRTEDHQPREKWATKFGLSTSELSDFVFGNEISRQATIGEKPTSAIWEFVADHFSLSKQDREQFEQDFWAGDRIDEKLLDFIDTLRKEHITVLLSNAWGDARQTINERYPRWNRFDISVFSGEVKLAKPDPKIYQYLLNMLRILPQEAIFGDSWNPVSGNQTNHNGN